jgi:DNA recombination protein RmuC
VEEAAAYASNLWKDIAMNPLVIGGAALVLGVLLGAVLVWFVSRSERSAAVARAASLKDELTEATARIGRLQEDISGLNRSCGGLESLVQGLKERNSQLDAELAQFKTERQRLLSQKEEAERSLAETAANLRNERSQAAEKIQLLTDAREQLSSQFKALAGEILEDKSARFTEQNKTNLERVLKPLETQLTDFKKKVEEAQNASLIQTTELGVHLAQLKSMNSQLSQDASNLTRALKSTPGAPGRFGEEILDRVLEAAGLREGLHYRKQAVLQAEDGGRPRPDVIVDLPGDRHLVIDSKMSLKDYVGYSTAEDEGLREASLAEHLRSVRSHLAGLSVKSYQTLHGLNSLDFVVMFMPIEPAFALAIAKDEKLWSDAWDKNVLLVSPSTLLFIVRTVANLWRQEQQVRNVREIVERGSALYDKFAGFVADLKKVGASLEQAKDAYDQAFGKLSTGSGNLIRQVEMLRLLGVKGKKGKLPPDLVEVAMQEEMFALAAGQEPENEEEAQS